MAKNSFILCIVLALAFTGCMAAQQVKDLPVQRIIVKVESATDNKVDVSEESVPQVSRGMEVPNPEGALSGLTFISGNKAFMSIFSGLSVSDVKYFWNDRNVLREQFPDVRDIHIFINSPGGDAFSGLALADEIERAKQDGFLVSAYGSGIIASAAVPIFAVCDKRYASEGTLLMVHPPAMFKFMSRETAEDIEAQNKMMKILQSRYIKYLSSTTKTSESEWISLAGKTSWFTAEEAKRLGLIDEIK